MKCWALVKGGKTLKSIDSLDIIYNDFGIFGNLDSGFSLDWMPSQTIEVSGEGT